MDQQEARVRTADQWETRISAKEFWSAAYKFMKLSLIYTLSPIQFGINRGKKQRLRQPMKEALYEFKNLCRFLFRPRTYHLCQSILNPSRDPVPLSNQRQKRYTKTLSLLFPWISEENTFLHSGVPAF
jgi:hypothetical protein